MCLCVCVCACLYLSALASFGVCLSRHLELSLRYVTLEDALCDLEKSLLDTVELRLKTTKLRFSIYRHFCSVFI